MTNYIIMAKPKKKAVKKTVKEIEREEQLSESLCFKKLVDTVRRSKNKAEVDIAFNKIVDKLGQKIKRIASKFNIPGNSFDDTYQECLLALQTKAIKDYNKDKGSDPTMIAPFDRFALLCIRRHLSTTLKASGGNKTRSLNESKSLDQDRSTDSNSETSLMEIICSKDKNTIDKVQDKEIFISLMKKLFKKLSKFEKEVLKLYAKQFSYEEITDIINSNVNLKEKVNVKGIDNALSRIKDKSKLIIDSINKKDEKRNKRK